MPIPTYKITKQNAYTLLGILISLMLSSLILSGSLHYFLTIIKTYNNLQRHFDYQNSYLIARHYLALDIRNARFVSKCNDKSNGADILYLDSITYNLRPSIIDPINHLHGYALYRDDSEHQAVALVEGLLNFQVKIQTIPINVSAVYLVLTFKDQRKMEAVFVPRNINPA